MPRPHLRRAIALACVASTACAGGWNAEPARAAARTYDARILRDPFGVPSIYGTRDADVAFGVAYAHAEDDFATIQEVVATSRARAGALLGTSGAPLDYAMHLLRVRETVAAKARTDLDAATWALLQGYAAGVNAYAADHPAELRAVVRDLLPVVPEDIIAGFVLRSPFFYGFDQVLARLIGGRPIPGTWDDKGSNAFVVAPSRSGDGTTRLLSNSHQPWTGPVAWYELRVHSREGLHFAGATFAGSPVPFLGHNATLGWTNTVNKPDLVDVYRLRLKPDDATQYWFDGAWRALERRRVWLKVKIGPLLVPVPKMVERSVHGPVVRNDSGAFALRYAGMDDVRQVMQYYRLVRARTWDAWRDAMRLQAIPATNFLYADATGRIAYVYNGLFPRRAAGAERDRIRRGDTSEVVWTGVVPFDSIPQLVNPPSGYLFNANNTPFFATSATDNLSPESVPTWMGVERTAMTNRAYRAFALLDTAPRIDRALLLRTKFDVAYQLDRGWAKRAMAAIRAADTARSADVAEARRLLLGWSCGSGCVRGCRARPIRRRIPCWPMPQRGCAERTGPSRRLSSRCWRSGAGTPAPRSMAAPTCCAPSMGRATPTAACAAPAATASSCSSSGGRTARCGPRASSPSGRPSRAPCHRTTPISSRASPPAAGSRCRGTRWGRRSSSGPRTART